MRKLAVLVALLGSMASSGAHAVEYGQWHEVTFSAPVPCAFVCPYWAEDANTDLDGNDKEDVYFQACANPDGTADALDEVPGPYQEGTVFDDVLIGPAPEGARVLTLELYPVIDYDGFVCDPETGEELASLATTLAGSCRFPVEYLPLGCIESGSIEVTPGKSYIFRAYNWSDYAPALGRYRFLGGGS